MSRGAPPWRLAFPMYNLTPALALAWQALGEQVAQGLREQGCRAPMQVVEAPADLMALWRSPDLLLAQTCGYPLTTALGEQVRVLATPAFGLPGCTGIDYRSAIVVPDHGARRLDALRGGVAAINQWDSHSGMNALRHCVAPLARAGRFFSRVVVSGSHLASLAMVQSGAADVAAIDCVSFALAGRHAPAAVAGLRVLQHSAAAPGLPFIAASTLSDAQAAMLRAVLLELPARAPAVLAALSIVALHPVSLASYAPVREMARVAAAQGYPVLA